MNKLSNGESEQDEKAYLSKRIGMNYDYDYFAERAAILQYDCNFTFGEAREQAIHEMVMNKVNRWIDTAKKAIVAEPEYIEVPDPDTGQMIKINKETGEIYEQTT